ncbi:hypothetical protein [Streptomyces sp. NPDC001665]
MLTAPLLDGFGLLPAAVRRLCAGGQHDLRATEPLVPLKRNVALSEDELLKLAAAAGPLEAAAVLAAGADVYAIVLHRPVEADPAA